MAHLPLHYNIKECQASNTKKQNKKKTFIWHFIYFQVQGKCRGEENLKRKEKKKNAKKIRKLKKKDSQISYEKLKKQRATKIKTKKKEIEKEKKLQKW